MINPLPLADREVRDCLAGCRWLDGVAEPALAALAAQAQWRSYQAGEHVYRSGAMPAGVFGVQQGSFKIVIGNRDGQDAVTTVLGAGTWFGEIFLCSGQAYFADCLALQAGRVLFIARERLLSLCEEAPVIYRNLLTDISRKALSTHWMSVQYKLSSPELRIAHRLEVALQMGPPSSASEVGGSGMETGWVELRERLSHELIAQMLGLSRPRVSQAMKTLQQAGVLAAGRGRLRIHTARLQAYCQSG